MLEASNQEQTYTLMYSRSTTSTSTCTWRSTLVLDCSPTMLQDPGSWTTPSKSAIAARCRVTATFRSPASYIIARVHKNKSMQLHTMGSVTAEFEVRHRWRTTTLFSGRYALNAEHVHARSLQKLHLFDWHFRLGLHFACTCSSKYSVQRWVQRSRINVFLFLVQTDVGSDDELRILPWQHS